MERRRGSRAAPCVHLRWACPNNHTYILALIRTHPISTGLITLSMQFRCDTLTQQYLIDTSSGLTIATKHQGSCLCWHCLSRPLKAKASVDSAMHNWSSLSHNTTNQPFKCLSMIRQREGTQRGSGTKAGEWKRGKLMEMELGETVELWSRAPLGDSSKSWTAAGKVHVCVSVGVCVCVCVRACVCMRVCVCAANSEQKTFFVALSENKRIQK